LMRDFANAATLGSTMVIPRPAAAASSDSHCSADLVWISCDDVLSWALLYLNKDLENVVDFLFQSRQSDRTDDRGRPARRESACRTFGRDS
jgi:hypothetical protein